MDARLSLFVICCLCASSKTIGSQFVLCLLALDGYRERLVLSSVRSLCANRSKESLVVFCVLLLTNRNNLY
jgi:hypothetical protein